MHKLLAFVTTTLGNLKGRCNAVLKSPTGKRLFGMVLTLLFLFDKVVMRTIPMEYVVTLLRVGLFAYTLRQLIKHKGNSGEMNSMETLKMWVALQFFSYSNYVFTYLVMCVNTMLVYIIFNTIVFCILVYTLKDMLDNTNSAMVDALVNKATDLYSVNIKLLDKTIMHHGYNFLHTIVDIVHYATGELTALATGVYTSVYNRFVKVKNKYSNTNNDIVLESLSEETTKAIELANNQNTNIKSQMID